MRNINRLIQGTDEAAKFAEGFASGFGISMYSKGHEFRKRVESDVMMQRMFSRWTCCL